MTRKYLTTLLALFLIISANASKKPIDSKIDRVTVFLNGAQVTREFKASLKKGTQTIIVSELSPFLDAKTIQIKGNGEFTIVSLRHQMNYIDEKEIEGDLKIIEDSINFYQRKFNDVNIELNALNNSEQFLNMNRMVKGTESLEMEAFKSVHHYYYQEVLAINKKRNNLNYVKSEISSAISRFRKQLNAINSKLTKYSSEVLLEIQSDKPLTGEFELSYLVNHASWYPSYDIKVQDIKNPMQLVYKANVQQNTGEDWDEVKLTFSNANPYKSGDLPVLRPYYLNYVNSGYNPNPYKSTASQNSYRLDNYISSNVSQSSGRVLDQHGNPVPYAAIRVSGTAVGTYTDEGGNFSITLPQGKNQLFVSSVGYTDKYQNVSASAGNTISMTNTTSKLDVVVINADADSDGVYETYAVDQLESKSLGFATTTSRVSSYKRLSLTAGKRKKYESKPITIQPMENQTSMEITLDIPFTIKSTGKQKVVAMNSVEVPAYYEYRSVPKLEKAAFLIARIADWGEYNLLEGEANLYFENTYIGKSILDVRFLTDTLNISLGRDKGVLVSRQKVKSQSSREFIGKDNIEKRQFDIKIRNNKKQAINIIVYDQVPLSSRPKDIEVLLKDKSSAIHSEKTGELKWIMKIDPAETKELTLRYQVKFPKGNHINIE
jgi:hypothetical protein